MNSIHHPFIKLAGALVSYSVGLVLFAEVVSGGFVFGGDDALSMGYYTMDCPIADGIVRDMVSRSLRSDPTLAGPLLRMHFHDCWLQGCDASILVDSTKDNKAEKDSPANLSLRGYEVIDEAKEALEEQCPGVVSCADIVAMAARDAVFLSGGPFYDIPNGRKDGRRSKIEDTFNLPPPFFNASALIAMFGQRGFTPQELVALSGGHTLGVARCSSFKSRLTNNPVDPIIDTDFVKILTKTCSAGDNAEQSFDETRNDFDNSYFLALQRRAGLLTSDQTLYDHPRTSRFVNGYALNQAMFFLDFQQAMIKMSRLVDVKQRSAAEVRKDCRKIN